MFILLHYRIVEAMVEMMLNEYGRLYNQNNHLNEELKNCEELLGADLNVIGSLQNEYEKILEENVKLKEENEKLKMENDTEHGIVSDETSADQHEDCRIEVKELQQQLTEKDEKIKQLMAQIDNTIVPPAKNLAEKSTQTEENTQKLSTEGSSESVPLDKMMYDSMLSESAKLKKCIQSLEQISIYMETIFEGSQNELLRKQAKIDELSKQLESQPKGIDEQSILNYECKLKEKEEREQILTQQLIECEEKIAILTGERENLTTIKNDLMRCISLCQMELCGVKDIFT